MIRAEILNKRLFSYGFEMSHNTTLAVVVIVAVLALFGVGMVTVATTTMQLQQAEASHGGSHSLYGCGSAIFNSGREEFFNGTERRGPCKL